MADFNEEKFKKALRGERLGVAATVISGIVLAAFIVLFTTGTVMENKTLLTVSLSVCPALIVISIALAAFCNLKFGAAKNAILRNYVQDILVENAASLRPERNSLTYYITVENNFASIKTNDYKERIAFDFSAFGKHAVNRSDIAELITRALTVSFCRMAERGARYNDVSYRISLKEKTKKPVAIIANGVPEKSSYKYYLKNK